MTIRTAAPVFSGNRIFEIDIRDIGERGQPCQHIGEFQREILAILPAQGCREFAHFLHEPHERTFDAAARILRAIHQPYLFLEFTQCHGGILAFRFELGESSFAKPYTKSFEFLDFALFLQCLIQDWANLGMFDIDI